MYIQDYFKNGKPKVSKKYFKSIDNLVDLLIEMNGSKTFNDVDNNFKMRDLVLDDNTKINMWDAMVERGCERLILICNNCKDIWIGPKDKCDCGCTTLTKTHESNIKHARNY